MSEKVDEVAIGARLEVEEYKYLVFLVKDAIEGLEDGLKSSREAFSEEFFEECEYELGLAYNLLAKLYPGRKKKV